MNNPIDKYEIAQGTRSRQKNVVTFSSTAILASQISLALTIISDTEPDLYRKNIEQSLGNSTQKEEDSFQNRFHLHRSQ